MALFSDWLQGPYVYKLYSYYGFASSQIAILYVVGFASSGFFGTYAGSFADRFGRKKMAQAFCLLYSLCCLTKLSSKFEILFLGRVFGGISTSLLFSVFESWYVYEHIQTHDFPAEWLSVTFSKATFWNGMLAILAGVGANVFAESLEFGPVSPFILAIPFLLVAYLLMLKTWNENHGSKEDNTQNSCLDCLNTILNNSEVFKLGLVQSLFEGNMYIFVFQWTPILDSRNPPLGMVFACFMVCIMIGSSIYSILLSKKVSNLVFLLSAVLLALLTNAICFFTTAKNGEYAILSFFSFLILEVSVGIYFPTIGYLRSQLIPENQRAGIMNWFRLPTNMITCIALLLLHNNTLISSNQSMFAVCFCMLLIALYNCCSLKNSEGKRTLVLYN